MLEFHLKLVWKNIEQGGRWIVKLFCGYHNCYLIETLVGYWYSGRLRTHEKYWHVA